MPELLALIACEKVIMDEAGNASLITMLENVTAEFPEGAQVPINIVTPRQWNVFAVWTLKAGETPGQTYKHTTEIIAPSSDLPRVSIPAEITFKGTLHKVVHTLSGIPVGIQGTLMATVRLETQDGKPITPIHEYPIQIHHSFVKMVNPVTAG